MSSNAVIGSPVSRVDGPDKVHGRATYAAEFKPEGLAYAALVLSRIPSGRIKSIDVSLAMTVPGVVSVITHENAPRLPYKEMKKRPQVDPKAGGQLRVFQDDKVLWSGQPIACVVADSIEQAETAADLIRVTYSPDAQAQTKFDRALGLKPAPEAEADGRPGETQRGDAASAFDSSPVKVEGWYLQPREQHNPIELHATIAKWDGDHLTLWDKTQWVDNDRAEIAHVFDIPQDKIRVISPFVGGAFGSALRTWHHVHIAAMAAKMTGRAVRLELTRREQFTNTGSRPHTEQHVALGALEDGRLAALIQEAWGQTSTYEEYAETTLDPPRQTYSVANNATRYRLVHMNVNTPTSMRAPGVATGVFAQEIAMDELAVALGMDPVELRLKNYAETDEYKSKPWSSKELRACYAKAADDFGWSRRSPEPRSMQDNGQLVGWGMATAIYPSHRSPAQATVRLHRDGHVLLRTAASDMGPGTYTSMTQVAADTLDLPVEKVRFELGDTDFAMAPVHGGSITMASVGTAVMAACQALQKKVGELAAASSGGPFKGAASDTLLFQGGGLALKNGGGFTPYGEFLAQHGLEWLDAEGKSEPGAESETHTSSAFGAVFAEVRVDPDLGTVRVPRLVGAYDVGRVINPKIAHSQCIGGMVGGIGMALLEMVEWDDRYGRVMNANLAEYLVPVCADIVQLEASFVPSDDKIFNPLGVKGLAEIAISGVAPAIANAVFHATGKRVRDLPILPERLLL
ncbi:xanthine dehydrogenase family protein molybdopterin-binding subunit [Phenylobacterium deserti]|uniref:Xanthine dehydrogenase family protein molybdopterin-binding subunit n=1 Tax=Phenylobacterium deserti TaxID=1914756 RepID=A0A328A9K5_9CAUL|nr:xanthine dehydrogenase family protein molybdopterin-binding subunit [Phenylobacterium deserti]RAK51383.1 xanthine dehydrogenase family protein molybdopterin-binding subunit [Phenylobacterium deserti]